jgi:hypothetical protein
MQKVSDKVFFSFGFLLSSWKESLSVFGATQFKLLMLATVKALKDFYSLCVQTPIFAIFFFIALAIQLLRLDNKLVQLITGLFITVLIINAFRPSVARKDSNYFNGIVARGIGFVFDIVFFVIFMPYAFIVGIQGNYILVLAGFMLLLSMLLVKFSRNSTMPSAIKSYRFAYILYVIICLLYIVLLWYLIFSPQIINSWRGSSVIDLLIKARSIFLQLLFINETWLFAKITTLAYFFSPFIIVMALFVADAQSGNLKEYVKAVGRAGLMIVYNYPFFLLLFLVACLVIYLLSAFGSFWPAYPLTRVFGMLLISTVLLPVYIGIIASFYIKRLHEQFQLYYRDN